MKIKEGFVLRKICGQDVVSGEGTAQVNYSTLIRLTPTAAFLFREVSGKEFTPEDLADLLVGSYEVDRETALADSVRLCQQWKEIEIAE